MYPDLPSFAQATDGGGTASASTGIAEVFMGMRGMPQPLATEREERSESDVPRYLQIRETLAGRIAAGDYQVGGFLPTEIELCAEFGVSRYTVREALRRLVDQGMLARRQGAGSEVLSSEPARRYVHQVRTLADLFRYALDTHLDIRSIEDVGLPAEQAEPLDGIAGESWILIRSVRRLSKGGEPICVTHSWIPGRFSWIKPEIPLAVGPLYAMLEGRSGETITAAVQRISAQPLDRSMADALGREVGAPALCILRRYSSPLGTMIASYNWHPGDSFTYEMGLQLAGSGMG